MRRLGRRNLSTWLTAIAGSAVLLAAYRAVDAGTRPPDDPPLT
jgi:hypothetical protein